ncbi:ferredoxin [Bradyrhizobium sp. LM6.11]
MSLSRNQSSPSRLEQARGERAFIRIRKFIRRNLLARKQKDSKRRFFSPPAQHVEDVVGAGLCTGCGMCASIAAPVISMGINIEGNMRPLVEGEMAAAKEGANYCRLPGRVGSGPWQA